MPGAGHQTESASGVRPKHLRVRSETGVGGGGLGGLEGRGQVHGSDGRTCSGRTAEAALAGVTTG